MKILSSLIFFVFVGFVHADDSIYLTGGLYNSNDESSLDGIYFSGVKLELLDNLDAGVGIVYDENLKDSKISPEIFVQPNVSLGEGNSLFLDLGLYDQLKTVFLSVGAKATLNRFVKLSVSVRAYNYFDDEITLRDPVLLFGLEFVAPKEQAKHDVHYDYEQLEQSQVLTVDTETKIELKPPARTVKKTQDIVEVADKVEAINQESCTGIRRYMVKDGDYLYQLARVYKVDYRTLLQMNVNNLDFENLDLLESGSFINLPCIK